MTTENSNTADSLALLRLVGGGVVTLDTEGRSDAASAAALRIMECRDLGELAAKWESLARPLLRDIRSGPDEPYDVEIVVTRGDDSRRIRLDVHPMVGRCGAAVFLSDAGAMDELCERLSVVRYIESLAKRRRDFSHDLRGPLNTIVLNKDLLAESLTVTDGSTADARKRQLEWLERIQNASRALTSRLETLLDYVLPSQSPAGTDLTVLVREAIKETRAQAFADGIEVGAALPESAVRVTSGVPALKRSILRYLNQSLGQAAGSVHVSLSTEHDTAVLRLIDDGSGETQSNSNATLQRGTPEEKRSSLELHMAYSLIAAQGGSVEVQSEHGTGTTVTVRLPLHADSSGVL